MSEKFPDRRDLTYTKAVTIRLEPELWEEFRRLKQVSKKDIAEAQRITLRELAKRLRDESEAS